MVKKQVMLPANEVDLTAVEYLPEKIEGFVFQLFRYDGLHCQYRVFRPEFFFFKTDLQLHI